MINEINNAPRRFQNKKTKVPGWRRSSAEADAAGVLEACQRQDLRPEETMDTLDFNIC